MSFFEASLSIIGIIWLLGIMLFVGLLFLAAVKSERALTFGHVLATIIWPIWLVYYFVKGRKEQTR